MIVHDLVSLKDQTQRLSFVSRFASVTEINICDNQRRPCNRNRNDRWRTRDSPILTRSHPRVSIRRVLRERSAAPKLIPFDRECIDLRSPPRHFAKVQVETASATPTAASGASRRRARRFQWGHARTRAAPVRPSQALSTRSREWALAHSHGRPLYHFRYRAPRARAQLTVHRSRRLLNPTLFSRALHNPFCNSTLRVALTGTPAHRHPHSEMGCLRELARCRSRVAGARPIIAAI